MRYFIASDHAGLVVKKFIKEYLESKGIDVVDLGPFNGDRVDYPDFAQKVCSSVLLNPKDDKGILICGTGIGMSMAANKFDGIRAALCHDSYGAKMAQEHNDANILCMGERVSGLGVMQSIIDSWLDSSFEGGRHARRVDKINLLAGCR